MKITKEEGIEKKYNNNVMHTVVYLFPSVVLQ